MKNKQNSPYLDKGVQEDIRKLVIARIKAASSDLRISIGSNEYTKRELLQRVEKGDEIGQEIMDIQMAYLKDIASGAIYRDEHSE